MEKPKPQSALRCVFVLRMWVDSPEGPTPTRWHFLLEDPFSKARRGFSSFEELRAFLINQTDPPPTRRN